MDSAKKVIRISLIIFIGTLIGCIANFIIFKCTVDNFAFIPKYVMFAFGIVCILSLCTIGLTALIGYIVESIQNKLDE